MREVLAQVVGKAGDEQAPQQVPGRRDPQRPAVQPRAAAPLGREQLVLDRVVDRARDGRPIHRQRHRAAEHRIAVREVRGAVQRIDVPHVSRSCPGQLALFRDDVVPGKAPAQQREHRVLALAVDGGDQVDLALVPDLELLAVAGSLDGARRQHCLRRRGSERELRHSRDSKRPGPCRGPRH